MELITAADLVSWSPRHAARDHLPTLVRRLILATVPPESVRMPAAESVGLPGFDGIVEIAGSAGPFVPSGLSVWELGTGQNPRTKAESDYVKRTGELSDQDRSERVFVFVSSRVWSDGSDWAAAKSDGWRAVQVIDAEDLATWLPTCPGVEHWFAGQLGRQPAGIFALRDWYTRWLQRTDPALPIDLVLAGRAKFAKTLAGILEGVPVESVIPARSEDEAIAIVAASLCAPPGSHESPPDTPAPPDSPDAEASEDDAAVERAPEAAKEARLERALVVSDPAAWQRWALHEQPLVLLPTFEDPEIDLAVAHGHHVLLPRIARQRDTLVPPLHRGEAAKAWERSGVGFRRSDELARAARRGLTSLRRRIGRPGHFGEPSWSKGPPAALLAPLVLLGAWHDDVDGDREILTAISGREWRDLSRDLVQHSRGEDPPLLQREHRWEFLDIVDAFDALRDSITADDLRAFADQVQLVLAESDPTVGMSSIERLTRSLGPEGPAGHRYSHSLREGIATTLAVMGATVGDVLLADGEPGEVHASAAVRQLLREATADRWLSLAALLPLLAEAAPDRFLEAVEESLRVAPSSVMALFDEQADGFSSTSRHSHLLWALERLGRSPAHISRVAVVLAKLAEVDPGGRTMNRPANSLAELLHIQLPQGAVDETSRLAVVDAVRKAVPDAARSLLVQLIEHADGGMMLHTGPKFRDWDVPSVDTLDPEAAARTLDALADRIAADFTGHDPVAILKVIERVPESGRAALLAALDQRWPDLDEGQQIALVTELRDLVKRHTKYSSARWSLNLADLEPLNDFLAAHEVPDQTPTSANVFDFWPSGWDWDASDDGRAKLDAARRERIALATANGIDAILDLARSAPQAGFVGAALAEITHDFDDAILDELGGDDAATSAAARALAAIRSTRDEAWLANAVNERPAQEAELLLAAQVTAETLDLVAARSEEVQATYWTRLQVWPVSGDLRRLICEQFLLYDRAWSALSALDGDRDSEDEDEDDFVELAFAAMDAIRTTAESHAAALSSPDYLLGRMLDRLGSIAPTPTAALLEWWFYPVLQHQRTPDALYRQLAADPSWFVKFIEMAYPPETRTDGRPDGAGRAANEAADSADPLTTEWQSVPEAWSLLRHWSDPLPGTHDDTAPTADEVRGWISEVRQALADADRTYVASSAIGSALAARTTDEDGTWPCEAVRTVLDMEDDPDLEDGLIIARLNQAGVTVRGAYDGGAQERTVAAMYEEWATRIRGQWPRAGALLDKLAGSSRSDARRNDRSADLQGDR